MTARCTDGQVCYSGTGARKKVPCSPGFYCPPETTSYSQYDNRCEPGFFCMSGTGESTKTRDNCPQTYYCPPGTGTLNPPLLKDAPDYSVWKTDALTRCPRGSGFDKSDTKSSILQCYINLPYKLMPSYGLEIRESFASDEQNALARQEDRSVTEIIIEEEQVVEELEEEIIIVCRPAWYNNYCRDE